MKLGKIASAGFVSSFKKLMNQEKVPVRTSLKMRELARKVNQLTSDYNDVKEKIASEHAVLGEDGKPLQETVGTQTSLKLDMTKIRAFFQKIKELDEQKAELPSLSIEDLGDERQLTLNPEDLFNLEFLTE